MFSLGNLHGVGSCHEVINIEFVLKPVCNRTVSRSSMKEDTHVGGLEVINSYLKWHTQCEEGPHGTFEGDTPKI